MYHEKINYFPVYYNGDCHILQFVRVVKEISKFT